MQSHASTLEAVGSLDPAVLQLLAAKDKNIEELTARVEALSRQVDWFRRQMFGSKSERLVLQDNAQQISLGEIVDQGSAVAPPPKRRVVAEHTRAVSKAKDEGESLPFFDETRVPVETIEVPIPEALADEVYDRIGQKITYRLAQRPAAYVVLRYVRPLIKLRESARLVTTPAPAGVIEGSRADVSFLAGMLVDKYQYHQPLYRIHQRLEGVGFNLSRPWLTQLSQQAIALLEPIYQAQLTSIKQSRIITMDETPIKAGREVQGKMRTAWFWPVHGEQQEICFPYAPTHQKEHIFKILGRHFAPDTVLLTDGNDSYARYAQAVGVEHAQCWSHNRRGYFEAKDYEPERAEHALELIARLYAIEDDIRARARWRRQALIPARAQQAGHRSVLPLGRTAAAGRCPEGQDTADRGVGLCVQAPCWARVVPQRSGSAARHQSSGARSACYPHGKKELELLLDRARRRACRHHAKSDRHVPLAWHRPLYLPGRCAAAGRRPSGEQSR